jgi:hypothetical protein
MKTAMQEFSEWLQAYEYELPLELQIKAKDALEKEKEQIMNAFSRGLGTELSDWETSEQYYERIYNQNK